MNLTRVVELVYLMLPAYCANMAPPFVRFWPWWNAPISPRWLGTHKTVIGFAFGVLAGTLVGALQSHLPGSQGATSDWAVAGLAQGVGAMTGDSAKSFLKRRLRIPPGESWIPADQLDFVLGAMLFAWPWLRLTSIEVLVILAFTFVADIAVNQLSFRLGLRDTKW